MHIGCASIGNSAIVLNLQASQDSSSLNLQMIERANAVLAAQWALPHQCGYLPIARLTTSVLVCAAAYGAALIRFGGPIRAEILEVVR